MGNREPSNHGHFSEQVTIANEKCAFAGTISETRLTLHTE